MGTAFTEETLQETIAEIDEDGSGQIEFEEFTILAAKFIVEEDDEDVQKELKEAFRLYDKEGWWFIIINTYVMENVFIRYKRTAPPGACDLYPSLQLKNTKSVQAAFESK